MPDDRAIASPTMNQTLVAPARTAHVEHGSVFTDSMVAAEWTARTGWQPLRLLPLREIPMHPAMIGLHYGQVIFEGFKGYRQPDGTMAVFRPSENARRFQRSARRLAMPELPEPMFLAAVDTLVAADQHRLPDDPELSLYLRPLMFASEANLMLRPSERYQFILMAFIAGGFFGPTLRPVRVWVERETARAFPGGTGDVKCAANYAGAFRAQARAQRAGCQQVVWLDAGERRWVEELGGMNLFFVRGHGPAAEVLTPESAGTLLPGVTRDSLLTLATRLGHQASREHISLDQWRTECEQGVITEAFACGTAAVVTPIGEVRDGDNVWTVGNGIAGPMTMALRRALIAIQHGTAPDPDGWLHHIPAHEVELDEAAPGAR